MANEYYDTGASLGALIPALLHHLARKKFEAQPLGTALGYPSSPNMVPVPGPIASMGDNPAYSNVGTPSPTGPVMPVGSPVTAPRTGVMTARPSMSFLGAPPQTQALLGQPVSNLADLSRSLGPQVSTDLLSSLGIGKGQSDAMQLEMGPDGSFRIKPGTTSVSSKNASVILRQSDLNNKADLTKWRDAVQRRLDRGQVTREEQLSLSSDHDLLTLMTSPQYDLMDDTIKNQLGSMATAAINRLQQRGVKVFTGSRAKGAPAPVVPGAAPAAPKAPAYDPAARFNNIKASNPALTDQQVYAQMAIEEASK